MVVMCSNNVEGHAAQFYKVLEALRGSVAAVDHVHHVVGKHEWGAVSVQNTINMKPDIFSLPMNSFSKKT